MLRAVAYVSLALLLTAATATAQPASSESASSDKTDSAPRSRARGADISRDEYIQKAVERARHNAEKRFEKMDTNHDGILTAAERRAAADERRAARAARNAATSSDQ